MKALKSKALKSKDQASVVHFVSWEASGLTSQSNDTGAVLNTLPIL